MTRDLDAVRPKLRHDSVFLKDDEGALLRGSHQTSFVLKGRSIYELISTLAPFMTGEMTVGELCRDLDPKRAGMVRSVIDTLLSRGVIKDQVPEDSEVLSPEVADHFRRQIELIDHYADGARARFKTFRESSVLMAGNGESLRSLAVALIRNGLERPYLIPDDGVDAHVEKLDSEVNVLREQGLTADFEIVEKHDDLSEFDLVVYCADVTSLRDIYEWQTRCAGAGRTFLPVTGFGGLVLVGPTLSSSTRGPTWLSGMMRLASNLPEAELHAALWRAVMFGRAPESSRGSLDATSAQMVGVGVAFEAFKLLAGHMVGETVGGVVVQKRETLETHYARLIPHPLDPTIERGPQEGLDEMLEFVAGPAVPETVHGELFDDYFPLIDPFLGLIHSFDDDNINQAPLKIARVVLGHPDAAKRDMKRVVAFSTESLKEARERALMESLKWYAQSVPDERDMIFASSNEMAQEGRAFFEAERLSSWAGFSSVPANVRRLWLPGYAVFGQEVRYVPAAAVHAGTRIDHLGHFESDPACWAVGKCFSEILQEGTLALLAHEDIKELVSGSAGEERIPEEALREQDGAAEYLLASLNRLDRAVTITRVSSNSPSATVVVRASGSRGEAVVVVEQALSLLDAIRRALTHLLGNVQLLERCDDGLSTFDRRLERLLRATRPPEATFDGSLGQTAASIEECHSYLRTAGREIIFVLTTPTDLRHFGPLQSGASLLTRPL